MTFTDWLSKYQNKRSPMGDLAEDVARDACFPASGEIPQILEHLAYHGACPQAISTARYAWRRYQQAMERAA